VYKSLGSLMMAGLVSSSQVVNAMGFIPQQAPARPPQHVAMAMPGKYNPYIMAPGGVPPQPRGAVVLPQSLQQVRASGGLGEVFVGG
jgi:multidrug efflux pump subunit AcrA (membrane-fusion protein)